MNIINIKNSFILKISQKRDVYTIESKAIIYKLLDAIKLAKVGE